MAISVRKKMMLIIWKILLDETDPKHKITRAEIVQRLEVRGYKIGERDMRTDIDTLIEIAPMLGYELNEERDGNYHYLWIEKRPVSLPELQITVDMILSSRFLTERKSIEMIDHLKSQVSIHERQTLQHQVYVQGRVKSMNDDVFVSTKAIQEGIQQNRRLHFYYLQWNEKKQLVRRYNGKEYIVSPLGVAFNQENYYLAAYNEEQEPRIYRIDKMEEITVLEDMRDETLDYSPEAFHKRYRKLFGMFGAKEETVTIACDKDKVGILLDRFGSDIPVHPYKDRVKVIVQVEVSEQFIGWMYGIADFAEIIGNNNAVKKYDDYLLKNYKKRFHVED